MGSYSPVAPLAHLAHGVSSVMDAVVGGYPAQAAPDRKPGSQPPARRAGAGRRAARGTAWLLRRANPVPFLLTIAAREMYGRPLQASRPLAAVPADSGPRPEEGMAVVVDLAAYRQHSRMARAVRLAAERGGRGR